MPYHLPPHLTSFALAIALALGVLAGGMHEARGQKPASLPVANVEREGLVNFEREILPILKANCIACHNESEAEGNLVAETPQTLLEGGLEGPALIAGNAEESLLFQMAAHRVKLKMPPKKNKVGAKLLTPEELGLLKLWIDQGAKGDVTRQSEPVKWQSLSPRVNPIYAVAISPDGQFAACGRANQVSVYHVPSGRELGPLLDPTLDLSQSGPTGASHLSLVQSLAFSPDGRTIASGGYRTVKLWRRQAPRRIADLPVTQQLVTAIALSADGKLCAQGQASGVISLIDLSSGQTVRTLKGHHGSITGLAFSPDATKLYSGSADKSLRAWNIGDGSPAGQFDNTVPVTAIGLLHGATQLAVGGEDNVIRIWPLPDSPTPEAAEPIGELKGHSAPITSLAVVYAVGAQIISGSLDGTLRHWNVKDGKQLREFNHGGPVTGVASRPDGKRFASVSDNKIGKLWNADDGKLLTELKGDFRLQLQSEVMARSVEAAKQHVEASTRVVQQMEGDLKRKTDEIQKAIDRKIRIDKELADLVAKAEKPASDKAAADKAVTDQKLAVQKATEAAAAQANAQAKNDLAQASKKLEQLEKFAETANEAHEKAQRAVARHQGWASDAIIFIPTARAAAKTATAKVAVSKMTLSAAEEALKQVEADWNAVVSQATASATPYRTVAFSLNGQQLALAGDDGRIQLYDATNGAATDTLDAHPAAVSVVAFTGADQLLSAADTATTRWSLNSPWNLELTIGDPNDASLLADRVTAVTFSPDGKTLATGGGEPSRGGELKFWNVADGEFIREVSDPHSDTILGLDFSPQGDRIVSGSADHFVKMFRVSDGAFLEALEGHTHHVLGVSWKFDGRRIVSCGADNSIKVWDLEADVDKRKRQVGGHKKEVTTISFIGHSDQFLTSSADMQVGLYRAADGRKVRSFEGATDYLYSAAASADGKSIIAGGEDSILRVWDGTSGKILYQFAPPSKEAGTTLKP